MEQAAKIYHIEQCFHVFIEGVVNLSATEIDYGLELPRLLDEDVVSMMTRRVLRESVRQCSPT